LGRGQFRRDRAVEKSGNAHDVAEASGVVSGVAERYANALFDLATGERDMLDPTLADLNRLAALIAESPDLTRLVRSPIFSTEDQMRAMRAVLDKAGISGLVANLVFVTVRNRRLFALPGIAAAFRKLAARYRGETSAEVTSAEPLSDKHVAALKEALKASLGKDVTLERKVDSALIGGLIVRVGSRMIDTSLRTKLGSLKIAMKEVR
jgi:F-type H+-transporting ATPase subunit delta